MSKLSDFFKNCPVPRTPLTKEESDIMMRLLMNNAIKEPMTYEEFLNTPMVVENGGKEKLPTALMAIWLRNVRLNNHFKMSVDASLFLSTVIDSFGDGTLYYSYVANKAKELGSNITLDFICTSVFPFGIFTKEQLGKMWDLQKNNDSPNGNLLDDGREWSLYLYGDNFDTKVKLRFSDEDERILSVDEVNGLGDIKEPRDIEGRMYFWLGKKYVSMTHDDYSKLENQ